MPLDVNGNVYHDDDHDNDEDDDGDDDEDEDDDDEAGNSSCDGETRRSSSR